MSQPICTCISYGCAEKQTTDKRGLLIRGKQLGVQEYRDHCRQDKRLGYDLAHRPDYDLDGHPEAAPSFPNFQSVESHNLVASSLAGDTHGDGTSDTMAWTSQEDELASNLESCMSVFRSGLLKEIRIDGLVFCESSNEDSPLIPPPLQSLASANTEFLQYQDGIIKLCLETEKLDCGSFKRCRSIKDKLLEELRNEWTRLEELKRRAWQNNLASLRTTPLAMPPCPDPGLAVKIDTSRHFTMSFLSPDSADIQPAILVVYILVASMHIVSGLSLKDCSQLLFSLQFLIGLIVDDHDATATRSRSLTKLIPVDARTVVQRLALKPSSRAFVCCPKCSTLYPDDGRDSYPEICASKHPFSQQICSQRLRKVRNIRNRPHAIPIRRFLYHDFKEWLGEMLCRPGMEDLMDQSFSPSCSGIMEDIWDAPGLYKIPGPDGRPFIRKCADNEGRYLFSFNMDGFNPFQLKQAGRSATVMGLYMVCLNLPPERRFRTENMFLVGIVPGPKEPSMDDINHFLKVLVDDLLESYITGVHYTRTWKYPNGRNTRSALALIICDLPAARQALGFTGPQGTNFCSYCKLQLENINNLDVEGWGSRSCEEHRKLALQWQDAPSEAQRTEMTRQYGIRYSEFLRLPYLDPIRNLCVDPMHAFFLRIVSRHCQDIWGMGIQFQDGDGLTTDPVPSEIRSSPDFQNAFRTLRTGTLEALRKFKAGLLFHLAVDQGIPVKGRKKKLLMDVLTRYRRDKGWVDEEGNPRPLSTQEQENIDATYSDGSLVSVSDAHTAMEYYHFSDSAEAFWDLKTTSLAHLYFLKVQEKPAGYDRIDAGEKQTWDTSRINVLRKWTKHKLITALVEARHRDGITNDSHELQNPDPERFSQAMHANPNRDKSRVLGRSRLQEIWSDMEKTILPSWCTPAPPRIGDRGQGKISADGWRIFCTVHLIVTLGRLWGSEPTDSRMNQLFANFCDLVGAIKIAVRRSITVAYAEEYRDLMLRYLSGVQRLFPMYQLIPYHHISIHLRELLCHFGPTTTWRCWVFERYNHMLQNIETNGRFGELEKTLFERMCMTQKLKGFASSCELMGGRDRLKPFVDRLEDFLNPTAKGTLFEDFTSMNFQGEECWLERNVITCLEELLVRMGSYVSADHIQGTVTRSKARQYNKYNHRGAIFSPSSFSVRDSHVAIGKGVPFDWSAGKVKQIFAYPFGPSSKIYFVIQKFKELSAEEALRDPYRQHPLVGGRLYHSELEDRIDIVPSQEIIAHFAYTPHHKEDFGFPCFHALPLEKVAPSLHRR